MGKTHKKSRISAAAKAAVSPLGNAGKKNVNPDPDGENELQEDVDEILDRIAVQLQEASPESKECGLQSLSLMVEKMADKVVEKKLVRICAPLMVSEKSFNDVRHSAVGALKNLSLVSAEICEEMIKQGVMTPLCALIKSYSGAKWSPVELEVGEAAKKNQDSMVDHKVEIFVEAVCLLWNLCEASPLALEVFNKENLIQVLLEHIDNVEEKFSNKLILSCMQCLYTVTEENCSASNEIQKNLDLFKKIVNRATTNDDKAVEVYTKILAFGILLNSLESESGQEEEINANILPSLVPLIAKALSIDHRKMCNDFTSICPLRNGEERPSQESMMEDETTRLTGLQELGENLEHTLHAKRSALEILTNLCCGLDANLDEWEDINDSDQSDECISLSASENEMEDGSSLPSLLPSSVTELIQSHGIVQLVISSAQFPPENVCQILKDDAKPYGGQMLFKMLSTLRSRSFLCLNNLFPVLNIDELGGGDQLFSVWMNLGKLSFGPDMKDMDLLEASTSAIRALTEKLVERNSSTFASLTSQDLKSMLEAGSTSTEANVRVNMVHITGSLAMASINSEYLADIVNFLCEAATRDVSLRVVAEALDKLFDIFQEDETDQVFSNLGCLAKLKQILPGLKTKIGIQRQNLSREDHALITMAKTNLVRFIKYKEQRGLK